MTTTLESRAAEPGLFWKDTLIKGQPSRIECVTLLGQTFTVTRGMLTVVALEDEWYEDVHDPEAVLRAIAGHPRLRADVFTFWQRLPEREPRHPYYHEWEDIAALPVSTYDHWWSRQIKSRVRSQIRKAEKDGIVVRETPFDDDFVRGMTAIFNEAPVRQGRPFWHYGKDEATVRAQFSRYVHRERMLAAYLGDEMIGLVMLGHAGRFALTGQILSSLKHRDKATTNVLVAKAVEVCAELGLAHLAYFFWSDDSLSEFKRRCGFERTPVPRYYIPLSARGTLAMRAGLHRGWRALVPPRVRARLKRLRSAWNSRGDE